MKQTLQLNTPVVIHKDSEGKTTPRSKRSRIVSRFLTEARITGKLEHPGIVPVYEIGKRVDGTVYYTMKLVKGETLEDRIKKLKTYETRLALLPHFVDVCNTIGYAHSKGVIHRDIKPQNIMIGDYGETIVLDWGLAKLKGTSDTLEEELKHQYDEILAQATHKTVYGKALGTPAYMSPEQANGELEDIDEQSDVFSLGCVLYEILTGSAPYSGDYVDEILEKAKKCDYKKLKKVNKNIPEELISITEKAMSKNKQNRYKSVKELSEEITKFISGGLVSAYDYSAIEVVKKWIRKNKLAFRIGIGALITLMILMSFYIFNIS